MGIKNRACLEVSSIIGARPPKVVSVVRMTGRKRRREASLIASRGGAPFTLCLFA